MCAIRKATENSRFVSVVEMTMVMGPLEDKMACIRPGGGCNFGVPSED